MSAPVATGLDRVAAGDAVALAGIRGKRVGLLAHPASVTRTLTHAHAVLEGAGAKVVALFGPSDPRRYGPLATKQRVLRVQLPCSPCGQVRLPPERCRGHVPDCMDGITVDAVVRAARELMAESAR